MKPMLASPGPRGANAAPPVGAGWRHEVKWDGVRLLADVRGGQVQLQSRSERDVSAGFPEFRSLSGIADDVLFDGEAIAWHEGSPSFAHVVDRVHVADTDRGRSAAQRLSTHRPATFVVFDVLRLDGLDLTALPLRHRRSALESIWTDDPSRILSQTYPDGSALLQATAEAGLEGVVSKNLESTYRPGERSSDWLKFAHRATGSYIVGGWRTEIGSSRLGSVLIGSPARGSRHGVEFRGRVGSGLVGQAGRDLATALGPLAQSACPFTGHMPQADRRGTVWVEPRLVVDVASLGVRAGSRLRQPSFQRLRLDLDPEQLETRTDGEHDTL
ncbi:MAG: DNA ligase [Ornithinimicrobium sp.]